MSRKNKQILFNWFEKKQREAITSNIVEQM